jgi:signal transduction histidine kinase
VCFHRRDGRDAPFTAWQATIVEILGQWANLLVEQRANVEQLVAERDRLDEFSAVVSHDLRTPLSVARGWIEIARKDGDVTGLVHAAGAIDNATELIDDLLTIARGGVIARQFEAVPVATLVSECWEAVAPAGATLNVTTARTVRGDPGRLRQVFENLFRNSVEHGGPEVTVTVGESDDGLYVADDGPGIPVEDRSRVTAPGYTSTDTGTGFGLNIVSQVVAAHGWELRLDESEGGGLRVEMAFEGRERPDREPLVDGSEEVSPSP